MMNYRRGMTLVELLAALTLSAMLMTVLLGVVSQQRRTADSLQKRFPHEPWKEILVRQFEQDYASSHHIVAGPTRIQLQGYGNPGNGLHDAAEIPSTVEYQVLPDSGRLVRVETFRLSQGAGNASAATVCEGVSRFVAQSRLDTDVAPGVFMVDLKLLDGTTVSLNLVRH